ncbi:MAG TPA: DivIVA domain-containing protein [Solirubrobacteraceae bacterium]|nr:DivIVA domain-containing protein [Solirubrobacteraceae bacterium]
MALDRQSIEKKDFPIGRRGYDPEAVDQHLATLADEVDELKRSSRRRTETLASAASEQVRAIVEAAETSASDIQRQAEEDARDIRAEATSEAQRTRDQAAEQAREYVAKVSESTAVMLQRLDAMESELGALIEALKTGSNRLNADVQLLEGNLTDLTDAATTRPRFEPEVDSYVEFPPTAGEPAVAVVYDEVEIDVADDDEGVADKSPALADALAAGREADAVDDASEDTEGARLIALNMALNGTPREETDRYLAENFQLVDRRRLLDEVYSSVE